jgi:hypothetical protein
MIGFAGLRLKLEMWTEKSCGRMAKIAKKTK